MIRKTFFFLIPALLFCFAIAFIVFGSLDNMGGSGFADHAAVYALILLFYSFPPGVILTYFLGRGLYVKSRDKTLVAISLILVALPWIISCLIFLVMSNWQGD